MIQLKRVYDRRHSVSDGVRFLVERLCWAAGSIHLEPEEVESIASAARAQ